MTYQMVQDIRNEAFDKIEQLPLKYIDGHPYGEVVSRVIADVDQFSDGLLMGFTQLFTGIATIIGTFCFMLSVNVSITFVVVLITPVSFFVANFIAKRTFRMFRLQSEIRGEQTGLIDEMIGNQKVVQAFGRGEDVTERFDEVNKRLQGGILAGNIFLIHHEPGDTICQQSGLHRSWNYRSICSCTRCNERRTIVQFLELCKSVHKAI